MNIYEKRFQNFNHQLDKRFSAELNASVIGRVSKTNCDVHDGCGLLVTKGRVYFISLSRNPCLYQYASFTMLAPHCSHIYKQTDGLITTCLTGLQRGFPKG